MTWNDPALTARTVPSLRRVFGDRVVAGRVRTTAEDFAYFARQVPGFYVHLGVTPPERGVEHSADNHSPRFFVDERALVTGVRILCTLAIDYLGGGR